MVLMHMNIFLLCKNLDNSFGNKIQYVYQPDQDIAVV
jgi:hypothetical protein